ncbi:hypothetical protein BH11ARM1_BH11ARM1_00970 [soil metagenome]
MIQNPKELWVSRVALLWAGIVIGCSFIATPAKFKAPSLSLLTALEIGRVTFRTTMLVELALIIIGVELLVRLRRLRSLFWWAMVIFVVQWLGVMPLLNTQTDLAVKGSLLHGPPWHLVYIFLEVVKVLLLLSVAFRTKETKHGSD